MNILSLENVKKRYGSFELDMSFDIPRGSIVGLVGRNGAGKTTCIKLIGGAIKKEGGRVELFGYEIERLPVAEKEKLAICYEDLYMYHEYNAYDIQRIMENIYKTWDSNKFYELTQAFQLDYSQRIKEYSRGMKMKLSIAIALSHATELIVMDEATSGLDPVARREILDILRDFVQDENKSVLISSHITSDLEKICDYIVFVHDGRVVLNRSINELSEDFAILKCSEQDFDKVDKQAIIGFDKSKFGVEALVYRNRVHEGILDNADLEDILGFISKEK